MFHGTRLFLFNSFPERLGLLSPFLQFLRTFFQQFFLFLGLFQQVLSTDDYLLLNLRQLLLQRCLLRPYATIESVQGWIAQPAAARGVWVQG